MGPDPNNLIVPEAMTQGRAYEAGLEPEERVELLRLLQKLMDHARVVNAGAEGMQAGNKPDNGEKGS